MSIKVIKFIFLTFFFLFLGMKASFVWADTATSTNFISKEAGLVILGGVNTSTSFINYGAGGQVIIGESSSTSFNNKSGILYYVPLSTVTTVSPTGVSSGAGAAPPYNSGSGSVGVTATIPPVVSPPASVIETVKKIPSVIGKKIISNLRGGLIGVILSKIAPLPTVQEIASQPTPLALSGQWRLLSGQRLNSFVFQPLPDKFLTLKNKFPTLENTLTKIGVNRLQELTKLDNVRLNLPNLTQIIAPPFVKVKTLAVLPISQINTNLENKIPTNVLFARGANEKVDLNTVLQVSSKGEPQQILNTLVGQTVNLVVKPDYPARQVVGYIILQKKALSQENNSDNLSGLASVFYSLTSLLSESFTNPSGANKTLVLEKFEYKNNNNGIFTAQVKMPVAVGDYNIKTIITYIDPVIAAAELNMVAVVDPEGYVYTQTGYGRARVEGVKVALYEKSNGHFVLWLAKDFQQENPQITDDSGRYVFLVPEGTYYLQAEVAGFKKYLGKPFDVSYGTGVHANIELKRELLIDKILKLIGLI